MPMIAELHEILTALSEIIKVLEAVSNIEN